MQIDRIFFPTKTLGPGKRLSIWTIGCKRQCKNCSNPELWEENPDKDINISDIISIIKMHKNEIEGITITGGEPFLQHSELHLLLKELNNLDFYDIIVFTGFSYSELSENLDYKKCLEYIGVLIDGEYVDELNNNIGLRGSSNQNIIILKESLKKLYHNSDIQQRESQIINLNNSIMSIGIPVRQ